MKIRCGAIFDPLAGDAKRGGDIFINEGKIERVADIEGVVGREDQDFSG